MKFNKTVLTNGLRIITVPMADNPSVTVLVMVEAGSKYETKDVSGISHFLEHMVFKGTPRRPKASDISRELDSLGAHYNAFTSQEYTGYWAKAAAHRLDALVDIVADMCQNSLLDENEMAKEKGVIIEELRMYRDLPQQHVQEVVSALIYGDQPAGWPVGGTEETVAGFTRADLAKYRASHYVSSATTVMVAGSFDEAAIIPKLEEAFGGVPASAKAAKIPVHESQSAPAVKAERKETDQTHLVIAVRTFPIADKRNAAIQVLSTILGGGMSSRLFVKLRDGLGICYYVRAGNDPSTDHGNLSVSAGVDNSRVAEAVKVILAECARLKDEPVPPAELQKAKDYISGTTMLELETSEARAEFCGYQEVLKHKVESPEEILKRVNAVTAADVQALAREIFVDAGLNLALIGRTDEKSLRELLRFP